MLSRCNHPSRVRPRSHPHERRRARGGRQPGLTSRTSPASASAPRLRLLLGEVATLGAIASALFLTAREGPRRTFPAAGAFVCLLVRGQAGGATVDTAGGATVDAAGGATVDVRTAAAGGAAAARTPAAAVAAPARLSPAIARAAKLVRTDISVSLDDRKSRGIRSIYLIFQLITRTPRSGCSKPSGVCPLTSGSGPGRPVTSLKLSPSLSLSVRLVLPLSEVRCEESSRDGSDRGSRTDGSSMAAWTISARSAAFPAS
jgi:hypothetical protein